MKSSILIRSKSLKTKIVKRQRSSSYYLQFTSRSIDDDRVVIRFLLCFGRPALQARSKFVNIRTHACTHARAVSHRSVNFVLPLRVSKIHDNVLPGVGNNGAFDPVIYLVSTWLTQFLPSIIILDSACKLAY